MCSAKEMNSKETGGYDSGDFSCLIGIYWAKDHFNFIQELVSKLDMGSVCVLLCFSRGFLGSDKLKISRSKNAQDAQEEDRFIESFFR